MYSLKQKKEQQGGQNCHKLEQSSLAREHASVVLIAGGQSAKDGEILALQYLNSLLFQVRLYKNRSFSTLLLQIFIVQFW